MIASVSTNAIAPAQASARMDGRAYARANAQAIASAGPATARYKCRSLARSRRGSSELAGASCRKYQPIAKASQGWRRRATNMIASSAASSNAQTVSVGDQPDGTRKSGSMLQKPSSECVSR
jgi:hypothetical protein